MKWILQDGNYALGNFVNITPVIKYLFQETGQQVPVHFETKYVREAYEGNHMIEILETKPASTPYASSSMICRANTMPDYQYAFELATGRSYSNVFKPFVHVVKRAVIISGSGSEREEYVQKKDPGVGIYAVAIRRLHALGYHTVFVGSQNDEYRHDSLIPDKCRERIIDDMAAAIQAVRTADLIIANDTGLAHVAGALDKRMLVLWKDTPATRAKNSGGLTSYSYQDKWIQDIETFINSNSK